MHRSLSVILRCPANGRASKDERPPLAGGSGPSPRGSHAPNLRRLPRPARVLAPQGDGARACLWRDYPPTAGRHLIRYVVVIDYVPNLGYGLSHSRSAGGNRINAAVSLLSIVVRAGRSRKAPQKWAFVQKCRCYFVVINNGRSRVPGEQSETRDPGATRRNRSTAATSRRVALGPGSRSARASARCTRPGQESATPRPRAGGHGSARHPPACRRRPPSAASSSTS
jgi:hypothetical protein